MKVARPNSPNSHFLSMIANRHQAENLVSIESSRFKYSLLPTLRTHVLLLTDKVTLREKPAKCQSVNEIYAIVRLSAVAWLMLDATGECAYSVYVLHSPDGSTSLLCTFAEGTPVYDATPCGDPVRPKAWQDRPSLCVWTLWWSPG